MTIALAGAAYDVPPLPTLDGATASALGLPDAGLATYSDMVGRAEMICSVINTPLIADADTGYGGLLNVQRTVRGYEAAGVAAIQIEDHYWNSTDAAVVFKRTDKQTGEARYIYHGNDGTSMPWNDTAQLDYLNPEVREAVIQTILHVARQFPVIRFDAAMTLDVAPRPAVRKCRFRNVGSGSACQRRSFTSSTSRTSPGSSPRRPRSSA